MKPSVIFLSFCMTSFTHHNYLAVHSSHMYQKFMPFYWPVVFHCVDILHFVYLGICWWLVRLFSGFGYYKLGDYEHSLHIFVWMYAFFSLAFTSLFTWEYVMLSLRSGECLELYDRCVLNSFFGQFWETVFQNDCTILHFYP